MAHVSARTPTFSRGSAVLDYWLAHAEGLPVQPPGARVEEVVVAPRAGRAEALIVRSRVTRRRKSIPAESIGAVEPTAGELLLDVPDRDPRWKIAAARSTAGAAAALAWLRPRTVRAGRTSAYAARIGAARTSQVAAWLAPRARAVARTSAAAAMRWTLAAAVIATHEIARAGRGAAVTAERARTSLESRRAR